MTPKLFTLLGLALITVLMLVLAAPGNSTAYSQVYYQTPTAQSDGRIIYIVKAGDTCLSISLLSGVSTNDLARMNNLDEKCSLLEGRKLLLGIVAQPTITPGPSSTPGAVTLTPTPFNGTGQICVYLFDDVNGNSLAEDTENSIANGAVSITDRAGKVSKTGTTTGDNTPVCFDNLPEGDYNISAAPPDGYNATTHMNYSLTLKPGDVSTVDFGAQFSSAAAPTPVSEGGRSPILGIMGGILVLGGAALGVYFAFLRRR